MVDDLAPLRAFVDDPATVMKTKIPRQSLLRFILPTNDVWLLFPAKVHCGQSLVDGRRESIVMDYNYNDEIESYRERPDGLVGRGGLQVREEIRMIRPGFYLGRAYVHRMFLVDFSLYNPEAATRGTAGEAVAEDCWPGEQARRTSAR